MSTVDDLSKRILVDVVTDFRAKNLGTSALNEEYVGPSIAALGMKYCADGQYPRVDFDLALKQLEESKFVNTGPMVAHNNPPGSHVRIIGVFSKREFVYLTEKGYKAAQKSGAKTRSSAPSVHISGGNFHQSTIGIGSTVATNINLGSQVGTINAAANMISQQGKSEVATAIRELSEAVMRSSEIKDHQKQEALQVVADIAKLAQAKPEARSTGTVKALIAGFPAIIGLAADVTTLWDKYAPVIRAFFGI